MKSASGIIGKIGSQINDTGVFLESKVHNYLTSLDGFTSMREFPYSAESRVNDRVPVLIDGHADIFATAKINSNTLLCLSIECKRSRVDQKHWVFEKRTTGTKVYPFVYYNNEERVRGIEFMFNLNLPNLGYGGMKYLDQAIQVFEFRETTGVLNRDNSEVTYKALKQANEVIKAMAPASSQVFQFADTDRSSILFLPVIVTTANLWLLDYLPENIDWKEGMIKLSDINLEPKDWVHYEFNLPLVLKLIDNIGRHAPDKSPTFIVNAEKFPEFIAKLVEDCRQYLPK